MSEKNLYESLLERRAKVTPAEPKAPRHSAAVVPWRRQPDGEIEVFWVQRNEELRFMGGWHAFPGGGLARDDDAVPVTDWPGGLEQADPGAVPGIVACAVRELFEELGVLLAAGSDGTAARLDTESLAEARRRLVDSRTPFREILDDLEVSASANRLVFAGRWITPPIAPLRFDNRFFLLEWPAGELANPELLAGELASGEWIRPAEAYGRWLSGAIIAAPPILHILKVLAEDGPVSGLERLRNPVETKVGPFRRIEFRPGVVLLPLATATLPPATHVNAYAVGAREMVLVDPGSDRPWEIANLTSALDDLVKLHGHEIKAIWLTHHHPDHVGGVEAVRAHLDLPVLAHPDTAQCLAERGIQVDGSLVDGQRIKLDGTPPRTLRVLHTPGHARGHLCFFDEDGGSLIAGDLVAGFGTIVVDPPDGNMDDYLESLDRMIALEPKTLFPGHGPTIKNAGQRLTEYREHRLWREERVLEAWEAGRRIPEEMVAQVYDDAPKESWPLAERQIQAHLDRLHRSGQIS